MKANDRLNLTFYKGSDFYSDGDIEDKILTTVQTNADIFHAMQEENTWAFLYHLTPLRRNLLEWYDFDKEADLLEIGAGCGALTSLFCEKVKSVTAVELSKRRSEIIAERTKEKENIEIIVGNLNDIVFDKKFDYITLIGVLEYAGTFTQGDNPYERFLVQVKSLLKENGTLIIAIENSFGLKYFAGAKEDHTARFFDSIEGYKHNETVKTFGRYELEELLHEQGFVCVDFYYPMPDYKLPTQIFSDEFVPQYGQMSNFSLAYDQERLELFDIKAAYSKIICNKQFAFFANSFLVFASQSENEKRTVYANFKRETAPKYQIETDIILNKKEKYSVKKALCSEAEEHIEQICRNFSFLKEKLSHCENVDIVSCMKIEDKLKFDFAQGKSLAEELKEALFERNKAKFLKYIDNYKKLLWHIYSPKVQDFDSTSLAEMFGKVQIQQTPCSEYANIDLILDNIFVENEQYTIIDYEWVIDATMPINYIMARTIFHIVHVFGSRLYELISLEDLVEFCCIERDEMMIYKQMEEKFQNFIFENEKYQIQAQYKKNKTSLVELLYYKESFKKLDTVLAESLVLQDLLQQFAESQESVKSSQ